MEISNKIDHLFSSDGLYWVLNYLFILFRPLNLFPVRWQLKVLYRCSTGKKLHLDPPKGFNEKLSWNKLYDHNPKYTVMADKFAVKEYVKGIIGPEYIVPCYGVWNSFDEIDFSTLPQQFILKCTHDSSGIVLCKDKDDFDYDAARKVIDGSLSTDYYQKGFEWPYKDVPRRVLADMLLVDGKREELQDYKWWCFNGEPRVMYITNKGRLGRIEENFYDMDFQPLDINHGFDRTVPEYGKPARFEEMKSLAEKLSKGIPFVRVDFFVVDDKVYFGEFTFFDHAGLRPFKENGWDEKLGGWIKLG